jgi:hypothetical protein
MRARVAQLSGWRIAPNDPLVRSRVFVNHVIEFMLFLARPLRDKCSSVPKGDKQSRAKVAHALFPLPA